jgi:glycosyltransferase involved in cell wall biosynthesis
LTTISIITTVLNSADTIEDCILSIRNQAVPVEHIIIDGGSTDGTLGIIDRYRSALAKVVSEKDEGIYDGMNKGIKLATGDIIGLLNADDLYMTQETLLKVIKVFEDINTESCYGDLIYVDPNNLDKITRRWRSDAYNYRRFYWGWMPPHPTFFVKRNIYDKYGLFNLSLGSSADYELMLRFLVKYRITSIYIPATLVKMRSGGLSNASLKNRLRANMNDSLAWKINQINPYPWTLFFKPLSKLSQFVIK